MAAAAAVLGAVALRREQLALVAVALLAGAYVGALFLHGSRLDARVPLFAGFLVLLPELVAWSAQAALRIEAEPAVRRLRVGTLLLAVAAATAAAAAVAAVTVVEPSGGLGWEATGVGAAVAVLALLVRLGRKT